MQINKQLDLQSGATSRHWRESGEARIYHWIYNRYNAVEIKINLTKYANKSDIQGDHGRFNE